MPPAKTVDAPGVWVNRRASRPPVSDSATATVAPRASRSARRAARRSSASGVGLTVVSSAGVLRAATEEHGVVVEVVEDGPQAGPGSEPAPQGGEQAGNVVDGEHRALLRSRVSYPSPPAPDPP